MTATGRIAIVVTSVLVAGLGGYFAVAQWDNANRVATVSSALGAVAAVGVAVWAATRTVDTVSIAVTGTGNATAGKRGVANTGVRGLVDGAVTVRDTGDAKATRGGEANTGVQPD